MMTVEIYMLLFMGSWLCGCLSLCKGIGCHSWASQTTECMKWTDAYSSGLRYAWRWIIFIHSVLYLWVLCLLHQIHREKPFNGHKPGWPVAPLILTIQLSYSCASPPSTNRLLVHRSRYQLSVVSSHGFLVASPKTWNALSEM